MTSSASIVVAGHICLDIIPAFDPQAEGVRIEPGKLYRVGPAAFSTGGAVSNTGIALHRLGVPTTLIGRVADDLFGQQILSILRDVDPALAAGMSIAADGDSSYSVVISPAGVDRSFVHSPGTNDTFTAADVPVSQLAGATLFHFGYPPVMRQFYVEDGVEMRRLLETVRSAGLTTSLDMCMPDPQSASGQIDWRAWLRNVLPHVDLFLPSVDEIALMLGRDDLDLAQPASWSAIADELLHLGAAIVVLKVGEQGLFLRTAVTLPDSAWRDLAEHAPCFDVDVVGTTGAGDCTIAGFLAAYVEGQSPSECLTTATAVGACSVESADSTSGVRPMAELRARIAAGWGRRAT